MAHVTRRSFLLSTAAFSVGCATRRGGVAGQDVSAPSARPPAVGQSWRYAKHDYFTRALIDDQIDSVAAVGRTIDIDSRNEATKVAAPDPTWGTAWLRKYIPRRELTAGPLPSEIQDPWGAILVDPHWSQVQVYETPIPLWPTQLVPGWKTHVNTKYKTPSNETGCPGIRPWRRTAGRRSACRRGNSGRCDSPTWSTSGPWISHAENSAKAQETVWLRTRSGRWVARESTGVWSGCREKACRAYSWLRLRSGGRSSGRRLRRCALGRFWSRRGRLVTGS